MRWAALMLVIAPLLPAAPDGSVSLVIRDKPQRLVRIAPRGNPMPAGVLLLPGDGGWRGAAVLTARGIADWGYEVFGFETKTYLEMFSQNETALTREQMTADIRNVAAGVRQISKRPVILVGWSQGAGMAVAAASSAGLGGPIFGVITIGLPESAVLGWDWKATLATLAHRQPDQPSFPVRPLLASVAPLQLWMIHGTNDEYTSTAAARGMFEASAMPKRLCVIDGANHRYDGHRDEMFRSIQEGLRWITGK
ncbi:MAG: alpha/beta hydrolase family protein [Bryobacteraceae bacterium]